MKYRVTTLFIALCVILSSTAFAQTDEEELPQEFRINEGILVPADDAWVCFFSGERGAFHISVLGKGEAYASPLYYLGPETEAVLSDIIWHNPLYDAELLSRINVDVNSDGSNELMVEFNIYGTSYFEEYAEEGGFGEDYWSDASLVCVVDFVTKVTLVQLAYAECTLITWTPIGEDDAETVTFLETQTFPEVPWEFPVMLPYQFVETVYHHMYEGEEEPMYDEVVGYTNEMDIEVDFRDGDWYIEEIPYAEEVEE